MKYLSDDGKVFNTERDCYVHEQNVMYEKTSKERFNKVRLDKLDEIKKKYEELYLLIEKYCKEYEMEESIYFFMPVYEIMNLLCGEKIL